jgi:4-amino-4-deoxy-L-arabinose transferase-like glycosyltransferase
MRIRHDIVCLYAAIVLLSLYLILSIFFIPLQQDEGVFLTIAQGLKNGLLPYLDFFDHKPPAIYFLFGFIAIFTENILVYKLLLITSHLASCMVIFLISKKTNKSGYYPVFFYLIITLIFEGQKMIAEPFGALSLLLALYVYISAKKALGFFLVGFLIGISILFKQTFIISAFAFLIYFIWQKKYWKTILFFAGSLLPVAAITIWLHTSGLLSAAYEQIILYNFKYYPAEDIYKVIGLLTPSFLYTLPIWVLFVYGAIVIFKYRNATNHSWTRGFVIIFLLATLPLFSFLLRHYPHYWLQVTPFVALIASSYLLFLGTRIKQLVIIFLIVTSTIFFFTNYKQNYLRYFAEIKLAQYIKEQNLPIYAENQFVGMYFLTDNNPPNKYLYITEVTDWSEQAEEKTIETLKNDDYLIIWPADSNYPYAKKLQSYIFENYKPIFWLNDLGVVVYGKE